MVEDHVAGLGREVAQVRTFVLGFQQRDVAQPLRRDAGVRLTLVELHQLGERGGEPGRERVKRHQFADGERAPEYVERADGQQREGEQPRHAVGGRGEAARPPAAAEQPVREDDVFFLDAAQQAFSAAEPADGPHGGDALDRPFLEARGLLDDAAVYAPVHPVGDHEQRQIHGDERQHDKREPPVDGKHQGKRHAEDQQAGDQRGEALDQEVAQLGGVADAGVELAGAAAHEERRGQPEQVPEVAQHEAAVERNAQPQGVEDASVADQQGGRRHRQHQDADGNQAARLAGREHLVDNMLQEERGADPGHDVGDRPGQHQGKGFCG